MTAHRPTARVISSTACCLNSLRPKSARDFTSTILVIVGATLLLFTIGAYGWMSLEQHHLAAQWRAQRLSSSAVTTSTAADSGITLLSIPKIGLQAAILEGTSHESLLLAPGHVNQTALPGEPGNAVIAAHRDTFFHRVDELVPGDDIRIQRAGHEYRYHVINTMIVDSDDLSVTRPTQDTRLTLITCYPTYYIGPAPKRLIVVATLDAPQPDHAAQLASTGP